MIHKYFEFSLDNHAARACVKGDLDGRSQRDQEDGDHESLVHGDTYYYNALMRLF